MNYIHDFAPARDRELLVSTRDVRFTSHILRAERASFVRELAGTVLFRLPEGSDARQVLERLRRLDPAPEVSLNHVLSVALHEQGSPHAPPEPAEMEPLPERSKRLAGKGVRVGIIDTGLRMHPWFDNQAKRARDGDLDVDEPDEDGDGALDYAAFHGTFCTGVVLQHAPGAEVVVRAEHGHLNDAATAAAIVEMVGRHRVDILVLPFGGYTHHEADLLATRNALAVARKLNPDLCVCAAAGNKGLSAAFYPAAFAGVIAVGGLDADENPAPFSNYGSNWVDCCSLAVGIVSTYANWNGAVERGTIEVDHDGGHGHAVVKRIDYRNFEGFARWSGTSFAAPRVAGAIAATMSPETGRPLSCTAREAVDRLIRNPSVRRNEDMGAIVNPKNYVEKSGH